MTNKISDKAEKIRDANVKKKRLLKMTTALVAIVAFCTTYALILPAITMQVENQYECGLEEHVHSEECTNIRFECDGHVHGEECMNEDGEYVCGYVVTHSHTELCYDDAEQLICSMSDENEFTLFEEEHVHTDECYKMVRSELICSHEPENSETEVFVCGMEETEGHTHTDECYEEEVVLVCDKEETDGHAHTDECADEETGEIVCGMEECEAYAHSDECYMVEEAVICGMEECEAHVHTDDCIEIEFEFGFGFVEHTDECYVWTEELVCEDEDFLKLEEIVIPHAHVDACFEDSVCICGEVEVVEHEHSRECIKKECGMEEHNHSEACYPIYQMEMSYEEENLLIKVVLKDETAIPHNTVIELIKIENEDAEYALYENAANKNAKGEVDELSAYRVRFTQGEEEVAFPDATITVEVTAKKSEEVVLMADEGEDEEVIDTETKHFTTLQILGEEVVEGATATIEAGSEDDAVMMFSLGSSTTFAVASSVEAYPLFNVQYYANMNRFTEATGSTAYIPVINTANGDDAYHVSVGDGGLLPKNGNGASASPTANDIFKLALTSTGNSTYKIAQELVPTEIYEAHENVIYSNALTVQALDVLYENTHYEVDFIRTQSTEQLEKQTLAGVTGLDESYWTKYIVSTGDVYSEYFFTNDPNATEVNGKKPIVISDGMTVRYVYHPTTADTLKYTPANFFDYDISTGSHLKSGSTTTMYTNAKGINSHSDSNSATSYLAFGNVNTGTGYGSVTWTDANNVSTTPNGYNSTGYLGCTFGLVSTYNWEEKRLVYSKNIDAPCFFTHEAQGVTGKTSYLYTDSNGSTMNFSRYGDTYTLASVSGNQGISASNLDVFTARVFGTRTLYSNDFWPMDGVNNGDIHFGDYDSYNKGYKKYSGQTSGTLPLSDDKLEHNSYFGLQFAVDFHLDGTYDGPLEYFFYGDDDMWVFLTDRTDPDNITTQLIADIGGVHSSVGSYTNLWDWIPNEADSGRHLGKGEYTLTFFYTERGASGSSCFMQFTIPDVIGTPILDTDSGELVIKKQIKNDEDYEGTFAFDYYIDSGMSRYYPYTIYEEGEDGTATEIQTGSVLYQGQFALEAGQYIVIDDLPVGTTYTVKETAGEYTTEWTYPNTAQYNNFVVSGEITTTDRVELLCINTLTYRMPDTGGEGTGLYMFGGVLLMGTAVILLLYNKRRRRAYKH